MNNYCNKGKELLLDLKRSDWLPPFDDDGIRTILNEEHDIFQNLQKIIDAYPDNDLKDLPDSLKITVTYLYKCMSRNHQYLNSYIVHRLNRLRELRWTHGPVIQVNPDILSLREKEYFANYNSILSEYNEAIGFDVTSDLLPPKDLLIEVRVLENCGRVMTDSGPVNLEKGTILFLRRSQVESFIREGKVLPVKHDGEC